MAKKKTANSTEVKAPTKAPLTPNSIGHDSTFDRLLTACIRFNAKRVVYFTVAIDDQTISGYVGDEVLGTAYSFNAELEEV